MRKIMNQTIKAIIFKISKQKYGINVKDIHSIEREQKITLIPQTPSHVKGVIHLRGLIIPVIDLKEWLALGETESTQETRILIVSIDERQIGIMVDEATDVIDLDLSNMESTPEVVQSNNNNIVKGIAKHHDTLIIMVKIAKLFDEKQLEYLDSLKNVESSLT